MRTILATVAWLALAAYSPAQPIPDFSGTWIWKSRAIERAMVIRQTQEELIIETVGLPQGSGEEAFWLNGSDRVEIYRAAGFWRRYQTSGRWQGQSWIGTVQAFAGWTEAMIAREPHSTMIPKFSVDSTGTRLTIVSSARRPPAESANEVIDEFEKAK